MSLVNMWRNLPQSRQIISAISVAATIGLLYLLISTTLKPKTDLLYSGLDAASAGDIIARLETMDVVYEVKGNAIYADRSRRDSLRLELARDGLPRQSVIGYELFDDVNSFSMTSDMFDTTYWRAKEGELARTILAMPSIEAARVHLGTQKVKGFTSGPKVQTASVTLTTRGGLPPAQAKAIQYLVALSVTGLAPTDVGVIDTVQGVVAGPGINEAGASGGMAEIEQAAQIKQDLTAMLEARVGRGNARVSVSLDFDREHNTVSERRFDPDSRVVKSQSSTDKSDNSEGSNTAVTVASNLPEGEAGGNTNNSERSETSETVTYEISEILTNTETLPGGVQRMTVAVLINDLTTMDENGNPVRQARTDEEMTILTELVSVASGLNETRGDQLSVKSLPFELPVEGVEVIRPGPVAVFLDRYLWSMIQALFLSLVALALGIFVVRPILTASRPETEGHPDLLPMSLDGNIGLPNMSQGLLDAPKGDQLANPQTAVLASDGNIQAIPNETPPVDPLELLKNTVKEQTDDAASLLAKWLDQDMQEAG